MVLSTDEGHQAACVYCHGTIGNGQRGVVHTDQGFAHGDCHRTASVRRWRDFDKQPRNKFGARVIA